MAAAKILVADDSVTIQKVIRLALANEGYEILCVSDGKEAAQQLALFRPDVVLVDVALPGRSAMELKADFNTLLDRGNTRFVLMSSAFKQIDETQVAASGFEARLVKPFDPAHLRQIISDVIKAEPEILPTTEFEVSNPSEFLSSHDFHQEMEKAPPTADLELDDLVNPQDEPTLSDDLWSIQEAAPQKQPPSKDADIRLLTESTFGGSDWNIQEPQVSLRPSSSFGSEIQYQEPLSLSAESGSSINQEQLEELVQKHVASTLQRLVERLVPDIAEKVIREEIHRILTEDRPS